MMVFEKREEIVVGRFGPLDEVPGLRAFFSTRLGGVSAGVYESLNVGHHTDDDREHVQENRRRLFRAVQVDPSHLVRQRQAHSDRIHYADAPGFFAETDACYTDRPGVYLSVTVADCVPVLFCVPDRRIAGVIHAGWRGTEARITQKTIETVVWHLNVDPAAIVAVVGPSISAAHYEVNEDVAGRFEARWILRNGTARPHLDLWAANRDQLAAAGVHRIHMAGLCTAERQDLFFSHRASGGLCGRMLGIIGFEKP